MWGCSQPNPECGKSHRTSDLVFFNKYIDIKKRERRTHMEYETDEPKTIQGSCLHLDLNKPIVKRQVEKL